MSRVLHCPVTLDQSPARIQVRPLDDARPGPDINVDETTNGRNSVAGDDEPGSVTGMDEELRSLLSAIETAVLDAESDRRRSLDELQQLAIELSVAIAAELVGQAIDAESFNVGRLVSDAVDQLGLEAPVIVTLHPLDTEQLQAIIKDDDTGRLSEDHVAIHSDPTMPRGHCRATNGGTTLLSELSPRLETIRTTLLEGLDRAQIERRQTEGLDTPLKRFPDRRDAAQRA